MKGLDFKSLDFITPRVEIIFLGCGHIGDKVKMLNFIILTFSYRKIIK